MFDSPISEIAINELSECMKLIVLIKLEFATLDLSLNPLSPIIRFLLALEVVTDCGVAFDFLLQLSRR